MVPFSPTLNPLVSTGWTTIPAGKATTVSSINVATKNYTIVDDLQERLEKLEQRVKELNDLLNKKESSELQTDLGFIVCDLEK